MGRPGEVVDKRIRPIQEVWATLAAVFGGWSLLVARDLHKHDISARKLTSAFLAESILTSLQLDPSKRTFTRKECAAMLKRMNP